VHIRKVQPLNGAGYSIAFLFLSVKELTLTYAHTICAVLAKMKHDHNELHIMICTHTSTVSTPFTSLALMPSSLASVGRAKDLRLSAWTRKSWSEICLWGEEDSWYIDAPITSTEKKSRPLKPLPIFNKGKKVIWVPSTVKLLYQQIKRPCQGVNQQNVGMGVSVEVHACLNLVRSRTLTPANQQDCKTLLSYLEKRLNVRSLRCVR